MLDGDKTNNETMALSCHQEKIKQFEIDLLSGFLAGMSCSVIFHPIDRALFLAMKHHRAFLSRNNFTTPLHGLSQTIIQRTISNGTYYFFQGQMRLSIYPYLRQDLGFCEPIAQFYVGMSAGSLSGILTNSLSAVKYYTWGAEQRGFVMSVREMWAYGKIKPFLNGTPITVGRDVVFSGSYEILRSLMHANLSTWVPKQYDQFLNFFCNSIAAASATALSGPLNYARTMQFATPPHEQPPAAIDSLKKVWHESKNQTNQPLDRLGFFQRRFVLGPGVVRVALGIAIGQTVFDKVQERCVVGNKPII